jgi:hypothetical protein
MGYKNKSYASLERWNEFSRILKLRKERIKDPPLTDNLNLASFPEDVEGYDLMDESQGRSQPKKQSRDREDERAREETMQRDSLMGGLLRFEQSYAQHEGSERTKVYVASTELRNVVERQVSGWFSKLPR